MKASRTWGNGYTELIAEHERTLPEDMQFAEKALAISRLFGQTCTQLVGGKGGYETKQLLATVQDAKEHLVTKQNDREISRSMALSIGIQLVLERNSKNCITELQPAINRWATSMALKEDARIQSQATLADGNERGLRLEGIVIGALTRPIIESALAVPALAHHDQSTRKNRNYDLALLFRPGKDNRLGAKKAQIKSACASPAFVHPQQIRIEPGYDPDITLISGCCDVTEGDKLRYSEITQAMGRELTGTASAVDTYCLDVLSTNLLEAIVSDRTAAHAHRMMLENV